MRLSTGTRYRIASAVGMVLLALWIPIGVASASEGSEGQAVYEQLCASCHGEYGRGDGPMAGNLTVRPPDFTRPTLLAGRTDAEVQQQIMRGGQHTPMAVVRTIKPVPMRAAIAYMRTLSVPGKHVSVGAGQDIYESFCWFCHGMKGNGKGPVAGNVKGPRPRDFTNENFVIEGREGDLYVTISEGPAAAYHGSPVMLEWGSKLTDQQRRDVIEYLKVLQAAAN